MTDNTDNEKVIEEAARAIYGTRDDSYDLDVWEQLDSAQQERYVCDARVALAVFEKALTPTDDGRGGVKRAGDIHAGPPIAEVTTMFDGWEGVPTWTDDPMGRDAALRWHARGVKDGWNSRCAMQAEPSSEVPEPSAEHECSWACGVDRYGRDYHAEPPAEPVLRGSSAERRVGDAVCCPARGVDVPARADHRR